MTCQPIPPQVAQHAPKISGSDLYLAALTANHGLTLELYAANSRALTALGIQHIAGDLNGILHTVAEVMSATIFELPLIVSAIASATMPPDFYSAAALAAFINHADMFDVELEWLADANLRRDTTVTEATPDAVHNFLGRCHVVAEIMTATCRTAAGARALLRHRDSVSFLADFRARHALPSFLLEHDRTAVTCLLGQPPDLLQSDEKLLDALALALGVSSERESVILDRALHDVTTGPELFVHGSVLAILESNIKSGTDVSAIVAFLRRIRGRSNLRQEDVPPDILPFLAKVWDFCQFLRDTRRVGSAIAGLHKHRHANRSFH